MTLPRPSRRLKGILAEGIALIAYLAHGYLPARRPACALAQTDLLFARGGTLVLVEVKYRSRETIAQLSLQPGQLLRLRREANALQKLYPNHAIRLDLCTVFLHWPFVRVVQTSS